MVNPCCFAANLWLIMFMNHDEYIVEIWGFLSLGLALRHRARLVFDVRANSAPVRTDSSRACVHAFTRIHIYPYTHMCAQRQTLWHTYSFSLP